jgi:1-acyl-sn-glycerol-3-phosphate acyltransferase
LCSPHGKLFNQLRGFFTRATVRGAGATINVTGTIHSDTDIFIVNHQSMMDIFTLEEAIGNDVRFIGRTGIMDVWPTSRIVDRVGHITVDQKDRRAIIKLMKDVKNQKGKKVVIFPEGTRSQTGRIGHFEAGTKLLVERLGLKAQPIVIKNILSVYNESGKFAKSGVVEIEVLPAVTVQEGWYEKVYSDMEIVLTSYQNEQNKKL